MLRLQSRGEKGWMVWGFTSFSIAFQRDSYPRPRHPKSEALTARSRELFCEKTGINNPNPAHAASIADYMPFSCSIIKISGTPMHRMVPITIAQPTQPIHVNEWWDLSRDMTKPTKWVFAQRRLRSAWASALSYQSSLSAWRKFGSLATH